MINQGIGLDAVALLGAASISVAAGLLILAFPRRAGAYLGAGNVCGLHGSPVRGGPDYLGLEGNNEQFFVFHLVLFVLAVSLVIGSWVAVDRCALRPATRRSDSRRSIVLWGVVAFIALGRWLPGVIDLTGGDPSSTDFVENPTAYLLIGVLDLGVVVPAAIAAAVGLRRGASWAREPGYAVLGWFALVPVAVAAMAITMQINGDPNATTGATVLFVVAAVVFTAGACVLYEAP